MTEDEQAVWDAMRAVYAAVLEGDSAGADVHLHPEVTIWDSEETALVRGLDGLAALRARRPVEGEQLIALEASDPVINVWGDIALLRHILTVRLQERRQVVRNTSVWRRTDGRWRAVHNHEDVVEG